VKRPSPAFVISLIALFVALGGTGYAALSVTGKNVKNNSLTGTDIKNSSLTGSDVKNRSLKSIDFALGQLPKGDTGSQGPQGPKGDAGAKGDIGPRGPSEGYVARQPAFNAITSTFTDVLTLALPAGSYVINASGQTNNNGGAQTTSECRLDLGGTVIGTAGDVMINGADGGLDRDEFAISGAGTLASAGTLKMQCRIASNSGTATAQAMTAVHVATLTGP
jgi:hypothetical protein